MTAKKNEKKSKEKQVMTAHDGKAERESSDRRLWERESDQPDGTTGNYS